MKLKYADGDHAYWLDGVRASGISTIAKIPTNTWNIDQWTKRMVALGMLYDHAFNNDRLRENLAVNPEDKTRGDKVAADALELAKAHAKADRGTQMHRVLELTLLNRLDEMLTDQQRRDAEVLRRTLDTYGLTPYEGLCEQFVAYPEYRVTGRFDCVLRQRDGTVALFDLKSGPRAVEYPQSVAVQLALYARAPFVSEVIEHAEGDKVQVTQWRQMPPEMDLETGYVLLVEPDAPVGTLHAVDIAHGWQAGQWALEIVRWRRRNDIVREVPPTVGPVPVPAIDPTLAVAGGPLAGLPVMSAKACRTLAELSELWHAHGRDGSLTPSVKTLLEHRARELKAEGVTA
jgi:hypothetical protein